MPGFYSTPQWRAVRLKALQRAGWCCEVCGTSVRAKGASRVDHRQPLRHHPELALALGNLVVKCARCDNRGAVWKGERPQKSRFEAVGVDGLPIARGEEPVR